MVSSKSTALCYPTGQCKLCVIRYAAFSQRSRSSRSTTTRRWSRIIRKETAPQLPSIACPRRSVPSPTRCHLHGPSPSPFTYSSFSSRLPRPPPSKLSATVIARLSFLIRTIKALYRRLAASMSLTRRTKFYHLRMMKRSGLQKHCSARSTSKAFSPNLYSLKV